LNTFPAAMRKGTSAIMDLVAANRMPVLNRTYNFHNRYEKLKQLLKDPSPKNIMLSLSKQYDDRQLQELLHQSYTELDTAYLSENLRQEFYSPLAYMMAIDYQTYLHDDILQKVDRASMSTSLEAREPFLDHHIIEWAARLPDQYKYFKGSKKYILKEIVHQYIPRTMMDRPKMGFAIPIESWLLKDLKDQVQYYLQDERIRQQGLFRVDSVRRLRTGFFAGKKELGQKIWYMLMFQMWYEKWM
jgi:asparagine synthase (glutamine-hydrolysing)